MKSRPSAFLQRARRGPVIGYTSTRSAQRASGTLRGGSREEGFRLPPHRQRMNTTHKYRASVAGEDTEDLHAPDWCAICRQHSAISHYNNRNEHKTGTQFGWVGRLLALDMVVERVADWYMNNPGAPIPVLEHLMEVYHDGERPGNHGHRPRR